MVLANLFEMYCTHDAMAFLHFCQILLEKLMKGKCMNTDIQVVFITMLERQMVW